MTNMRMLGYPFTKASYSVLFQPNPVDRNPGDAWLPLNHFIKIIYEKCAETLQFLNLCGSGFNLGQAHKHLLIQCNSFIKAHNITFIQMYNFYKGISSHFKMIYKMDVQSLNCFHKISMFKRNRVNAYDGAYFVNFLNDSELLDLGSSFNFYQSPGTYTLIKTIH